MLTVPTLHSTLHPTLESILHPTLQPTLQPTLHTHICTLHCTPTLQCTLHPHCSPHCTPHCSPHYTAQCTGCGKIGTMKTHGTATDKTALVRGGAPEPACVSSAFRRQVALGSRWAAQVAPILAGDDVLCRGS